MGTHPIFESDFDCLTDKKTFSPFELAEMDPEIQKNMAAMRQFRQQQQNCMAKVMALKQTQKRVDLTSKELSSVPKDTLLYAAVGRCFIYKSREAIDSGMAEQQRQLAEQVDKTEAQKIILEKKEKETKETIEELMKNKQPK